MPDSATDLHRVEVPVTHEDLSVLATALHGRRKTLPASVLGADVADLIAPSSSFGARRYLFAQHPEHCGLLVHARTAINGPLQAAERIECAAPGKAALQRATAGPMCS